MGTYRQPDIIKNSTGLQSMTAAHAKFNEDLLKTYDSMAKAQASRRAQTQKLQDELEKRKIKDYDEFNKSLEAAGIDQSDSTVMETVKELREEYWKKAGSLENEDKDYMSYLRSLPEQIANGVQISDALFQDFDKTLDFEQGTPNSMNLDQVDPALLAIAIDKKFNGGKNIKFKINRDPESADYMKGFWTVDRASMFDPDTEEYTVDIDGSGAIDDWEKEYTSGDFGGGEFKISNSGLIQQFGDPKNRPQFFPTLGDMNITTDVVMEGTDTIPGLNEVFTAETITVYDPATNEDVQTKSYGPSREKLAENLVNYNYTATLNDKKYSTSVWSQSLTYALNGLEETNRKLASNPPIPLNAVDVELRKTFYGDDQVYQEGTDPIDQFKEGGTTSFGPYIGYMNNSQTQNNNQVQWQRKVLGLGHSQMILDNPAYNKQDVEHSRKPHKAGTKKQYKQNTSEKNQKVWQNRYNINYSKAKDYYSDNDNLGPNVAGHHKKGDAVNDLVKTLNTQIPGGKTGYYVGSDLLLAPGGNKTIQEIATMRKNGDKVGKYFTQAAADKWFFGNLDDAIDWALGSGSTTVYNTDNPSSIQDGIVAAELYDTPEALATLMTDAAKIAPQQRQYLNTPQAQYHAFVQDEIRMKMRTLTGTKAEKAAKIKQFKKDNCLADYSTSQGKKCFAKWQKNNP